MDQKRGGKFNVAISVVLPVVAVSLRARTGAAVATAARASDRGLSRRRRGRYRRTRAGAEAWRDLQAVFRGREQVRRHWNDRRRCSRQIGSLRVSAARCLTGGGRAQSE